MVTPVACFGAAHRKENKQHLCKMRRLLRSIVGPPGDVDWTKSFIIGTKERKSSQVAIGLKSWSAVCLGQYWKFVHYVCNLLRERWVVRAMIWFPENVR